MSLDSFNAWMAANPEWLGLAIFLIAFLECAAIVGIVLPGVVLLFGVAVIAGSGALGLGETLLLAYAGGVLGDLSSYWIGRRFHQNIRRLPGLRSHPQWITAAEVYFERYGIASLLVGRFIGALRPMLPMVAGMLDMPFGRFLGVSLIAAAGWAVAYLLPGWATGAALRLPLPEGFWSEAGIVAACLAVLVGVVVQASLRRKRWATAVAAALSLVLLLAMTVAWPYLQDLDQGLMTLVQEHRNADLNPVMVVVTRLGDFRTQFIAGALLGGILLLTRQWRPAIFAIGTLVGTALANQTLKTLFARARPEVLAEPLSSFSFPGGHSSASFAFFLTLGVLASRQQPPRWRLTWVLLAVIPSLSIALSRVYLGVHWPSDIVAGALLATTVCAASLWLNQRRESLPALPQRVWWLLLPVCVATLAIAAGWALPEAIARYRPL
ncbi:bifunctional DedA family/phosphatase PAP2 family protein [Pseudomonas aeruginosa]|uniref:bifunctional DedA family/phosphatase PAP2 family protein n=1 Tax=Pseudomonas aeruginosa TaxID=287 RepID=UPI0010682712|nr:bifunctional DedA family/phosphatase PAP2 family protein [Pseudomonas aeruginosa]TEL31278.1 phosphatase PAP2 family protein [Pseudomonas aeruginosa]